MLNKEGAEARWATAEGPCTSAAISREVGSAVAPRLMGAFHSACRVRNILDREGERESLKQRQVQSGVSADRQTCREEERARAQMVMMAPFCHPFPPRRRQQQHPRETQTRPYLSLSRHECALEQRSRKVVPTHTDVFPCRPLPYNPNLVYSYTSRLYQHHALEHA